jgi:hypothetical protein
MPEAKIFSGKNLVRAIVLLVLAATTWFLTLPGRALDDKWESLTNIPRLGKGVS